MVACFRVLALLLLVGQPLAFANTTNVYDISPNSLPGFNSSSREKQEQMLVAELEARISTGIRRAAKYRLMRHTGVILAVIATMVVAYKMDVTGTVMNKYDELRGNLEAIAKRHIRDNEADAYEFIQGVNREANSISEISTETLKDFFSGFTQDDWNQAKILEAAGHQSCIQFLKDGKNLYIPENYWPGIVDKLGSAGANLVTHIEFPEPQSPTAKTAIAVGKAATQAAVQVQPGDGTVSASIGAVGVVMQWAGNWWIREGKRDAKVDITKLAGALRGASRVGRLGEAAKSALVRVGLSAAAIWNWKEVLSIGAAMIGTGIQFYDRVVIPVLPRLYDAGKYAVGFPFLVRDDYILAFRHVTYSPLIVDEREYIRQRHLMYPPLVKRVDQVLMDANSDKVSVSDASQFVRYALRMPLTEKFIRYDRAEVGYRFDEFFRYYSSGTRNVFHQIFENALAENILVDDAEKSGVKRSSTLNRHVFLHGQHGVGKTYGVTGFSEILRQPMGRSQLHATDQEQNEGVPFGQKNATPGRIARGLMQDAFGVSYHTLWSVVLYDEADASFNSPRLAEYWKAVLDPNGEGVYLPYFGVTFPWPHNVFFIGNQKINDPALVSRMDIGHLEPYNANQKVNILVERIVPRMLRHDFSTVDFQAGEVRKGPGTNESYEFSSLPEDLKQEILNLVDQHQDDPGMRKVEAATKRALGKYRLYHVP